jgi:acyl-CoA thioesterase-1
MLLLLKKMSRNGHRVLLPLLLLFFVLSGCEQRETPAESSTRPLQQAKVYEGTIIALGDSLTAGLGVAPKEAYPALLEEKLQQNGYNWQVINGGISGETSSGALSRINWIIARKPDIVILETGANDGMRGIPPDVIRKNISRSVELLQEAGIEVVLAGMQMLQNLGPAYTKEFAAVYPAVAAERQVILVPFFLAQVAGDPALNLPDGIHPTPAGQRLVMETVFPFVLEAIRKVR